MRRLSEGFMEDLRRGSLAAIREAVIADKDLDLYIRDRYLNVYYKGNSLLKLSEGRERYRVEIDEKFLEGLEIGDLRDERDVAAFVRQIPALKANIIKHGQSSLEVEYEQLIVRANNNERRNNSEYYVVDRQYTVEGYRFDLLGVCWRRARRRKGQTVAPCLMEVKFALNPDIGRVHEQLQGYYELVRENVEEIVTDLESVFRQRLELGLYDEAPERLEAMKTLRFAREMERFQFILVLVDYNPHSSHLRLEELAALPFAQQVRLFYAGFGMWEERLVPAGRA